MNEKMRKHVSEIIEIVEMECIHLEDYKGAVDFEPVGLIFGNQTNIVFSEKLDYDRYVAKHGEKEVVLKLEMPEFNSYIYIVRGSNTWQKM